MKTKDQGAGVRLPLMTRRAPISSVNEETRTASVIWSTGARVKRSHWIRGEFYEELSLDPKHVRISRLQNKAPLLNSHNAWTLAAVLGVVESARIEGGKGVADVRFSTRKEVDPIFDDVRSGILTHTSAGYRIYKMERLAEPAEDGLPVYRAVDWEPYEISVVPMGADDAATFRGADGKTAGELFDVEIRGEDQSTMHPKQYQTMTRGLRAPEDGSGNGGGTSDQPGGGAPAPVIPPVQRAAEPAPVDLAAIRAEATAAERTRSAEIKKAVKAAKLPDAFADDLIGRGIALDASRAAIIDKLAADEPPIEGQNRTITVGQTERDKWQEGASAWLIRKAGMGKLFEKDGKLPDPGEFRGMRMLDLARDALDMQGVKTRGLAPMTLVGQAFTYRANITQSTSDFAILLENTMHKVLLAQYATTPDSWSRFCGTGSVGDFRPHNRYRLGLFGRLDDLAENGEFKNKSISDAEKELIAIGTVGNMINISRQMVVNDDMGGFSRLAVNLGRAAKLSIEIDVFAALAENSGAGPLLNDGKAIFHTDHANIATTAAYPSVTAVDAVRAKMARQRDPSNNEYLDLRPSVAMCATELGGAFRVINAAEFDPDGGDKRTPNKVRNIFKDIVDTPRLSGNGWYVFDPMHPVLEVAFLDGNQEPLLESKEGWRTDGVEWKVRMDYGVGAVDYRGAARNTGAAPA